MAKLITLTKEERLDAVEWFNDPDGANEAERRLNEIARLRLQESVATLELALAHPDDPDCAKLLQLLKSAGTRP